MSGEAILLRGGRVVDPSRNLDQTLDVLLRDGVVAKVDEKIAAKGADVVEAAGFVVAPGFVDLHTHLREPGFEYKETIATGTRAAAAGGFTAVCAMANTDPPTTRPPHRAADAGPRLPDRRRLEGTEGVELAEIGSIGGGNVDSTQADRERHHAPRARVRLDVAAGRRPRGRPRSGAAPRTRRASTRLTSRAASGRARWSPATSSSRR